MSKRDYVVHASNAVGLDAWWVFPVTISGSGAESFPLIVTTPIADFSDFWFFLRAADEASRDAQIERAIADLLRARDQSVEIKMVMRVVPLADFLAAHRNAAQAKQEAPL